MSKIAAAVIGSAVIGGISSNIAANKAAGAAKDSTAAQLAHQERMYDKARDDINRLFPQATERRNQGFQQQMDFLSSAMPATMDIMQQGNMNAQGVLAGSMPQMQNAILGGQIDYGFMQPQQINYEDQVQNVLAGLPTLYDPAQEQVNDQTQTNDWWNNPNINAGNNNPNGYQGVTNRTDFSFMNDFTPQQVQQFNNAGGLPSQGTGGSGKISDNNPFLMPNFMMR